jgi:hypothetical protein
MLVSLHPSYHCGDFLKSKRDRGILPAIQYDVIQPDSSHLWIEVRAVLSQASVLPIFIHSFIHFIHPDDQYSLIQDMSTYI